VLSKAVSIYKGEAKLVQYWLSPTNTTVKKAEKHAITSMWPLSQSLSKTINSNNSAALSV